MLFEKAVCLQIGLDRRHCPAQFGPILPVARIAKSAEPLVGMGLQDRSAGAYDFPSLAPGVARGTERTQAPRWRRSIYGFRQGTLAGRLTRAIDVKDEEVVPVSAPQPAW